MSAIQRLGIDLALIEPLSQKRFSDRQEQTKQAFSYEWARRDCYESDAVKRVMKKWLFERYCNGDPKRLEGWLAGGRKIILDVGCGSGFSTLLFFGEILKDHDYLGVDISDAVDVAKVRFREEQIPGEFLKASLMDLPVPEGSLDMVFSEGVLHHTDSTEEATKYLSTKLKKSGLFLFYVYAKKAVIREFTDDHIRSYLQKMTDEEAWEALKPLTKLGKALGELDIELEVPEDIPCLGIRKGMINLQRFFYWNICKVYYRPEFSLEEMNHFSFDWFRPLNCHRHTPEEVKAYCKSSGLDIEHMNVQEPGITVVARKR